MPQNRQCKTKKDYHYYRVNIEPKHDENNPDEYEPIMDYIEKTNDLEIISTCAVAIWLGAAIKQQKYNSHILPSAL